MFKDEMIEVLEMIPYKVWEEATGYKVDKVSVSKHYTLGNGENARFHIIVFIRSGLITYAIEGFDSIDDRKDKLLSLWKPYRDLIQREIEEYNKLLQEPVNYLPSKYTSEEIEIRLDRMFESDRQETQLKLYIIQLGLKPLLKSKCLNVDHPVSDKIINDTALSIIVDMVKGVLSGESAESVLKKYRNIVTKSEIDYLEGLAEYCRELLCSTWEDDQLYKVLQRFLFQKRSLKNLYKEVDRILEDSKCAFNEKELEYCKLLAIDKSVRRNVLSLDSKILNGWVFEKNYYARGMIEGMLYTLIDNMYKFCLIEEQQGKNVTCLDNENPLWKAVRASTKEYNEYPIMDFKDIDNEIYKKDEKEFKWKQVKKRINKCLSMED